MSSETAPQEATGTAMPDDMMPGDMSPELAQLQAEIEKRLSPAMRKVEAVADLAAVEALRVELLGRKGAITELSARLTKLSPAEKPIAGKLLNNYKASIITALNSRKEDLEARAMEATLLADAVDVTLPGVRPKAGHIHPVTQVMEDLGRIFRDMGYRVESGPEIETEWFNFEALNMPADHPARDMQDTFYTERGAVLRTHTSPTQIRSLKTIAPPLAVVTMGRVYRCDSDTTHSPMFHQLEGLLVDRGVSMAQLKGTLEEFLKRFFGKDTEMRFRPSFFPFTEPSAEVDMKCEFTRGGWMEILGCGLVHPKVLENAGLDSKIWTGFAFGVGVDRLAMLRHGITDIRLLFENDVRFLKQF